MGSSVSRESAQLEELQALYVSSKSTTKAAAAAAKGPKIVGYGSLSDAEIAAIKEKVTAGIASKAEADKANDAKALPLFKAIAAEVADPKDPKILLSLNSDSAVAFISALLMELDSLYGVNRLLLLDGLTLVLRNYSEKVHDGDVFKTSNVKSLQAIKERLVVQKDAAEAEAELIAQLDEIISRIDSILTNVKKPEDAEAKYSSSEGPSKGLESKEEDTKIVLAKKFLSENKVVFADLSKHTSFFESYYTESASKKLDKKRLARIKQELSILKDALPEGIHVCVNEDRYDKMIVMITGPEGTPYENGCFFFDFYLPAEWPAVPPKMNLINNGNFRFNPNLYTTGYVCFSLLGTWAGPGWDASTSTLLQLFVSVQAMILCEHPYCNEPSWENRQDEPIAKRYNWRVTCAKYFYAIQEIIGKKFSTFPEILYTISTSHFALKKGDILKSIDSKMTPFDFTGYEAYDSEVKGVPDKDSISKSLTSALSSLEFPKYEE